MAWVVSSSHLTISKNETFHPQKTRKRSDDAFALGRLEDHADRLAAYLLCFRDYDATPSWKRTCCALLFSTTTVLAHLINADSRAGGRALQMDFQRCQRGGQHWD